MWKVMWEMWRGVVITLWGHVVACGAHVCRAEGTA